MSFSAISRRTLFATHKSISTVINWISHYRVSIDNDSKQTELKVHGTAGWCKQITNYKNTAASICKA